MSLPPTEKPHDPDGLPETLLARCLIARESGDEAQLQRLYAENPEYAAALRSELSAIERLQTRLHGTSDGPPGSIGSYRILDVLGEGGMGTVYLAEQREPVRRRVALKVIKLGMDTKQVLARFEAERQALAMMNHDNIARVFEAGSTDRGQPYFVMEHVAGRPLTEHCDRQRLGLVERLRLFQRVCEGVQHAHQKGVIHRDLKPSNVLVAAGERGAVPKIIDFGLARATDHRLTGMTLYTQQGQIVGTPEYMSPEQADPTAQDIDTRTDVYSLGVMLYETLVGARPFQAEDLAEANPLEVVRMIREDEPARPSTRAVSMPGSALAADRRGTTPQALGRSLRGDLDWIVLRAMEKDRSRRYATVAALIDDIQRHLDHEPVEASPPGTLYRLRKFVRRYRGHVIATSVLLFALAAGAVGTTLGMLRAERKAHVTSLTNQFLQNTLLAARPEVSRGKEVTVREMVESSVAYLEGAFPDEPEVEASLRLTYGMVYDGLGRFPEAERQLRIAHRKMVASLGPDALETCVAASRLARVLAKLGQRDRAIELLREVLATYESTRGQRENMTLLAANDLGVALLRAGRYGEAAEILRRVADHRLEDDGADSSRRLNTLHNLAHALRSANELADAERVFREILPLELAHPKFGEDHPIPLKTMLGLAQVLGDRGALEEAEALARRAVDGKIRVEGEKHPDTRHAMRALAAILRKAGKNDEAADFVKRAGAASSARRDKQ